MSLLDPITRTLEHFVYERVCALSEFSRSQREDAPGRDDLASPLDGPDLVTNRG